MQLGSENRGRGVGTCHRLCPRLPTAPSPLVGEGWGEGERDKRKADYDYDNDYDHDHDCEEESGGGPGPGALRTYSISPPVRV
jgi:hypothetical protein